MKIYLAPSQSRNRVPGSGLARVELATQLADRAVALGEDVVVVDRLEVDLARQQEVAVTELGVALECAGEREADGVLDEARLQVRVLDDEQLVGTLQQCVHRRAHRSLDHVGELLRVDGRLRPDVERPQTALVVGRERHELEDPLDVALVEAGLERRSDARPRTSPCAHGHALIPGASTPTTRRVPRSVAAAIPISVISSCVGSPVTAFFARAGTA